MNCKYCESENVVKHGVRAGLQRYLCKDCNHHFYDTKNSLPRMRTDSTIIVTSLNLYYSGLSMRKVREQIENIYGKSLSQVAIHYWVHKYAKLVKDYVSTLQPKLSGKYYHDETEIKVNGEGRYFWETIDEDTRFIVASLLTQDRTSQESIKVFKQALEKQKPIAFFTDGSFSYAKAFNKVFWSRYSASKVEWVRRVGIRARETNQIIERKHSTLKMRYKVMRGLKNDESSKELLDGYITDYNFCRKHQSIYKTPAQEAGLNVKGWKELIENAHAHKINKEIQNKREVEPINVKSK
jgi:transposase-like protein